jgi:hypothetical protein
MLGRRELPVTAAVARGLEDLADRAERGEHPRPPEWNRTGLAGLLDVTRPAWWPAADDPDPAY